MADNAIQTDRPTHQSTRSPISAGAAQRVLSIDRSVAAVAVSAVGFGFSPFFATRAFDAGVEPVAASLLRIALLALVLLPAAPRLRGWRRETAWSFVGGAASMLGFAGYFVALDRAPVAAATVVYYTYPLVVLALSAVVWKRGIRRREMLTASVIVAGVILSVGPGALDASTLLALLPAVAAPIGWGVFLMVLSGPAAAMPTAPKMLAGALGGVTVLTPLTLLTTGPRVMPMTASAAMSVGLLALCTLAIPALLITWGAPGAGDQATAMIGSMEFVVALAVSWTLMGAAATPTQALGAALVCVAAAAAARRPSGRTAYWLP